MKRLLVCVLLVGVVGCSKDVSKEATEIARLTEAIESAPTNPLNYYERAMLYGAAGQKEQEITDLTMVIELEPTHVEAYYLRGESYRQLAGLDRRQEHYWQELEKAIADFTKVIELYGEHGYRFSPREAYVKRGDAYRKLGERDKAAADFAKAGELKVANDPAAQLKMGLAHVESKDWVSAEACFTRAIELNPTHELNPTRFMAYYSRVMVYRELGENKKAVADYTKLIEVIEGKSLVNEKSERGDEGPAALYYGRGLAYQELGEEDKADADFAKAKELGYEPPEDE